MFSKILGKSEATDLSREAPDSRGLEVTEDDPETAWSLWDSALAEQDSRLVALPTISMPAVPEPRSRSLAKAAEAFPDMEVPTQPLGLDPPTPLQRMKLALDVVELHHHRIAQTIRTLWGYRECSVYINTLIMNGGDGMGHARIGFHPEAADAMMVLADLHDAEFGPMDSDAAVGFADSLLNTGINGHR